MIVAAGGKVFGRGEVHVAERRMMRVFGDRRDGLFFIYGHGAHIVLVIVIGRRLGEIVHVDRFRWRVTRAVAASRNRFMARMGAGGRRLMPCMSGAVLRSVSVAARRIMRFMSVVTDARALMRARFRMTGNGVAASMAVM